MRPHNLNLFNHQDKLEFTFLMVLTKQNLLGLMQSSTQLKGLTSSEAEHFYL